MALVVEDITVRLQGKSVLDRVSLSVEPGEVLAICGANGAGKSTLLKAISKDILPASGSIHINGSDIHSLSSAEMALKRAMMPQQVDIHFHFSARELIEIGLFLTQSLEARNRLVDKVAQMLDLKGLLDRSYLTLSGGQKQRVQLARVIGQILQGDTDEPRYLLLDECTSAMDIAMVGQVFSVLTQLVRKMPDKLAVIAVVHDLNIASLYADRIAFIHRKSCSYVGKPQELLNEETVQEVFGTPVTIMAHPDNQSPMVMHKVL